MTVAEKNTDAAEALKIAQERLRQAQERFDSLEAKRDEQATTVSLLAESSGADSLDGDPLAVSKKLSEARLELETLNGAVDAAEAALNVAERGAKAANADLLESQVPTARERAKEHQKRSDELKRQLEEHEECRLAQHPFGGNTPKSKRLEAEVSSISIRAQQIRKELNRPQR